ncbi:MAG: hypothetical protein ACJA2O_003649, partial [Candidatus Azotimanducaceae bacterium]
DVQLSEVPGSRYDVNDYTYRIEGRRSLS